MGLSSYKSRLAAKITTDLLIIILLHLSYFIIKAVGHPKRGFFCDDNSIRYPYKPDTVSFTVLVVYSYLLPLVTIVLVEILVAIYRRFREDEYDSFKEAWPPIYNFSISFLLAAGVTFALTTAIKYTLGRLRPHFLDVCNPDTFTPACTGYIATYNCRGTNAKLLEDAFISFISGHASTAASGTVFAVLYLQYRLKLKSAPLMRPLLQAIIISSCLYIGYSRVTDFKHHGTDVLGGLILGSLCSITTFFYYTTSIHRIAP